MADVIEPAASGAAGADDIAPIADIPAVESPSIVPDAAPADQSTKETKPSVDDTLRAAWDKLNPKRDEQGRFLGREKDATEPTEPSTDQPAEAASEPAKPAIAAPLSWSSEQKAKWASLPPDLQQYIAHRDKESHEAISRAGQQLKAYEPIGQIIQHFADTWQRNKLHPADGIARLLAVEQNLAKDPHSAIKDIAKAYGVDLRTLATDTQTAEAAQTSPEVSAIRDELLRTRNELGNVTSYLTAQQAARLQSEEAAVVQQIASFAEGKPHFESVRRYMGALMQADEGLSLEDAYDRAVMAHPDVRKLILAEQQKADQEKRDAESRKRAAEAKKAALVNVKSSTVAGSSPRTMDDTLRETARRLYGHLNQTH